MGENGGLQVAGWRIRGEFADKSAAVGPIWVWRVWEYVWSELSYLSWFCFVWVGFARKGDRNRYETA